MVIQAKQRKVRLSITVAPELKKLANELAEETNSTPSGIISQCLQDLANKRKDDAMISYYKDIAAENKEIAQKSIKVIQKIVSAWGD